MSDKTKGSKPSRKLIGVLSAVAIVTAITAGCYLAQQQTAQQPPPPITVATNQPSSGAYDSKTDPDRGYVYAGLPRSTDPKVTFTILKNKGYLVGYSESRKDPLFAAYHLVKVVNPPVLPRPAKFTVDPRTEARVRSEDYARSGYDRGHMAPNHAIATRFGEEAQLETFLMSNICPQRPDLNRKVWEHLEATEADDYANRFEELWVIDGPIFSDGPSEKLPSGIDVPMAFYKVIVDEVNGKPRMLGFIMPQAVKGTEAPKEFLKDVRSIEKLTHLDFFWKLDKDTEEKVETETPKEMW